MSEPTKEAMDEAIGLRLKFCAPNGKMSSFEVAKLIAEVRTQAINDTLEVAAKPFDNWPRQSIAHGDYVAAKIRAMKVPT